MILKIERMFLLSLISSLVLSFCGCATTSHCNKNQPTMAEVYQETQQQMNGDDLNKIRNKINLVKSSNKNTLFKRLPNPEVVFYVYPHYAGEDDVPVPGYTTSIPMFKKVHYVMAGEI